MAHMNNSIHVNTIVHILAFINTIVHMRKSVNTILHLGKKLKILEDFRKLEQKITI